MRFIIGIIQVIQNTIKEVNRQEREMKEINKIFGNQKKAK